MTDNTKFFGVYTSKDSNGCDKSNDERVHVYTSYNQAAVVLKENKDARFKIFNSEDEARYFSHYGSVGGKGTPHVSEGISFKHLKRPKIYDFRRCIENDDYTSVKRLIRKNPRYLIGVSDTPTIIQETARYNALHIAAKHNRARIAELILSTVSNPSFTKLLYGAAGENSYIIRPELLVDLYLNTPDKFSNETPLHFAAKYGAVDVIAIFIQYPQLKIDVKNTYEETPRDITCKQIYTECTILKDKIHKMLNEVFYVPVWRSNDDVVQPIVGKPYSHKNPPICPEASSPASPSMEIKAIAGPMTYDEATNFHKSLKSPIRSATSTLPGTPHLSQGVLFRNPLEMDKGLEKIGRALAMKSQVSWKEYWPFLDKFIDIKSEKGLKILEKYLKRKINPKKPKLKQNEKHILSPMSELCHKFAKCTISSNLSNTDLSNSTIECDSAGDAAKFELEHIHLGLSNKKICDKNNFDASGDGEDGQFFTAPNSPLRSDESDDEMEMPDEGPEIYITDDKGTSVDYAVLEALTDVVIDHNIYPNIYRWKHSILLHSTIDRFSCRRPISSKITRRKILFDE